MSYSDERFEVAVDSRGLVVLTFYNSDADWVKAILSPGIANQLADQIKRTLRKEEKDK